MLDNLLKNTVYVLVRKDQFQVRHIESKQERSFPAASPFTTRRLLVGQFKEASDLLKKAITEVGSGSSLFRASPVIVIHPLDMVENGLSEVEERVFLELAMNAGARRVLVHVGAPLSDSEISAMVNAKKKTV